MTRTRVRHKQIRIPDNLDDQLTPAQIDAVESTAEDNDEFYDGVLSQIKRIIFGDDPGDWDKNPAIPRALLQMNQALSAVEERLVGCRVDTIDNITVPAAQNWVVLNAGASQVPVEVGATIATTKGAILAVSGFSGVGFDVNEVNVVPGQDDLNPYNLVLVRDASTGGALLSSNRIVFGLLQAESTFVDGSVIDDATNRVKISFVRPDAGFLAFEPCPIADIQGFTIDYAYTKRLDLVSIEEECTLPVNFFLTETVGTGIVDRPINLDFSNELFVQIDHNRGVKPLVQVLLGDLDGWNQVGWNQGPNWNISPVWGQRLPDNEYTLRHYSDNVFTVFFSAPLTGTVVYF